MKTSAFLALPVALLAGALTAHAYTSRPGRLLLEYPDESIRQNAKIHFDRGERAVADSNIINHRLNLQAYSQHVADDILRAEQQHLNTIDARYFQVKAVEELRDNELEHGQRDLRLAEDALNVASHPVVVAQLPPPVRVPEVREERREIRHHRRVHHRVRHHRHCKCD